MNFVIPLIAIAAGLLLLQPKLQGSALWRATVTPLASIIGSGFLVVIPVLAHSAGSYSLIAMSAVVFLSVWLGSALRCNILAQDQTAAIATSPSLVHLERLSGAVLAMAYVISVAFYLRLMSGFVLSTVNDAPDTAPQMMTTAVLCVIGIYGYRKGLSGLEKLEIYSVTVKLAIICALLCALLVFNLQASNNAPLLSTPDADWLTILRQLAGLLLVVQGFETSLYLGSEYPAKVRAQSMLFAQILAGVIYIGFVGMSLPLMGPLETAEINETAIIEVVGVVAWVLPMMLVIAAVMSQFSASIADTIGAAGVIQQETGGHIDNRSGYLLITGLACALVWTSNIFEIIAYASRAFALYYLAQTLISVTHCWHSEAGSARYVKLVSYAGLSVILLFILLFAAPLES